MRDIFTGESPALKTDDFQSTSQGGERRRFVSQSLVMKFSSPAA